MAKNKKFGHEENFIEYAHRCIRHIENCLDFYKEELEQTPPEHLDIDIFLSKIDDDIKYLRAKITLDAERSGLDGLESKSKLW